MKSSILVTGGAGFIGSEFVRSWVAEHSDHVVVLDKLTYAGSRESLADVDASQMTFVEGDVVDHELLDQLFDQFQPRWVVNFAAESHVDRSIRCPGPFVESNIVGTWQLLEAAVAYCQSLDAERREQFRFLQASTDEVYGSLAEGAVATEASAYAPNSPYSAAKASADHLVRAFHQTYGLPTLVVCSSNNYGPFQFPEKLIPVVIGRAAAGKPIPIYGDGLHQRDWLHVADNCRGIRTILERGTVGESYNLASGNSITNLQLVAALCQEIDKRLPASDRLSIELIEQVPDRPGHDRRYALDTIKAKSLSWKPTIDLSTGLAETVRWYLDNAAWCEAMVARAAELDR